MPSIPAKVKSLLLAVLAALPLILQPVKAEDSPETKAILKGFLSDLKSKKAAERVKAADAIGELGEKGKSARRGLCEAMLDTNQSVRIAAANALGKVDKKMAEIALAITINSSPKAIVEAKDLKSEGEPLVPIVWTFANRIANGAKISVGDGRVNISEPELMVHCLEALASIGPNDEKANQAMINAILFTSTLNEFGPSGAGSAKVRASAVVLIRGMKNAKLALRQLLAACKGDQENIRVEAIKSLEVIYDNNNDKVISKVLEELKLDLSEPVRKAAGEVQERIAKKK